jgi:hypothetical protein
MFDGCSILLPSSQIYDSGPTPRPLVIHHWFPVFWPMGVSDHGMTATLAVRRRVVIREYPFSPFLVLFYSYSLFVVRMTVVGMTKRLTFLSFLCSPVAGGKGVAQS